MPTLQEIIDNYEISSNYVTDISLNPNQRIIALSDIHADIHALIIALRDCAKVITSIGSFEELNNKLDINIYTDDGEYIDDLGFEWCGGDANIVIIGDIIDGSRGNDAIFLEKKIDTVYTTIHDFHQIEIKILRFINAIHEKAIMQGGCIHKLLGNHELVNILAVPGYTNQTFQRLQHPKHQNYIMNRHTDVSETRITTFQPGGEGYRLLFENKIGLLLKINNNIFVHGSLRPISINIINKYNDYINNPVNLDKIVTFFKYFDDIYYQFRGDTYPSGYNPRIYNRNSQNPTGTDRLDVNTSLLLWGRHYGMDILKDNSVRIDNNYDENINCKTVEYDLKTLMGEDINIDNYRVIVGHCIQASNKSGTTFTNIISSDEITETLGEKFTTGEVSVSENRYFGITMECKNRCNNHFKLYRVDVGSSRAQDQSLLNLNKMTEIKNLDDEKKILYGRTPQVLQIYNNDVSIIRSLLTNTLVHQPRPRYNTYRENKNFKNKYLKYKNKYLSVKDNL